VRDTGCGIPPELHDRVFERFFQADASRSGGARSRGTGLGLAIVKHAVERLRGQVLVDSEVGKGTTVAVNLPSLHNAGG
jgi:two-component system phosphate regulon sensor histidine kinase PhoR